MRAQVKRRLTGRGVVLFLLAIGQFLLAVHFSNNLIFFSSCLSLALIATAAVTTWKRLENVRVRLLLPPPVPVGSNAYLRFMIEQGAEVEGLSIFATGMLAVPTSTFSTSLEAPIDTTSRRVIPCGGGELRASDPFELFRVTRDLEPDEAPASEIAIYPTPDWANPAPALAAQTHALAGRTRGEFAGLRPFRTGDAKADVSWRASARHRSLIIKEYETSGSDRARVFELTPTGDTDLEPRLSGLAASVIGAARDGAPTGLRLPGIEIVPDRSEEHLNRLLAALAAVPGISR